MSADIEYKQQLHVLLHLTGVLITNCRFLGYFVTKLWTKDETLFYTVFREGQNKEASKKFKQ